jgi:hypothetical protein
MVFSLIRETLSAAIDNTILLSFPYISLSPSIALANPCALANLSYMVTESKNVDDIQKIPPVLLILLDGHFDVITDYFITISMQTCVIYVYDATTGPTIDEQRKRLPLPLKLEEHNVLYVPVQRSSKRKKIMEDPEFLFLLERVIKPTMNILRPGAIVLSHSCKMDATSDNPFYLSPEMMRYMVHTLARGCSEKLILKPNGLNPETFCDVGIAANLDFENDKEEEMRVKWARNTASGYSGLPNEEYSYSLIKAATQALAKG